MSAATVVLPPPAPRPDEPACWDLVLARLSAVPEPIDDRLRADIKMRDAFGVAKYGQRLKTNDGRNPLIDAYQENLDLVCYLAKDNAETEHRCGRFSEEHYRTETTLTLAIQLLRRMCIDLERRGIR